ncbi:MAG: ferredoxin family protein [Lentisphaerae bacterium]|jgi:NAD-dependent dihydropyrimidine dehydrogenase PreA subunit|nr:ferredoxin family protein [Lentisphaerota bacterium]MBT4821886.1 ferredoxin family protein [Lentisphaerota bacterium]MBT5606786.1 ferredoxin family protein [Lentisphaerota bacterium]MBT7061582.1 ferredoxin family protein [Lentisphaerota bacterium]MBT7843867.1 ferredoxin family protein [Lentisphaerota bacterium]
MARIPSHVLVCRCSQARVLSEAVVEDAIDVLKDAGVQVTVVPDLCRLAATPGSMPECLTGTEPLGVAACHERALRSLTEAAGMAHEVREVHYFDLRNASSPPFEHDELPEDTAAKGHVSELAEQGDWVPWFPVIDYDRCVSCGQCHSFCLFGVYATSDDGRVTVTNPQGCKTNCPACARICPEVAIIFPKLSEAPLNGAAVDDEAGARARVQVDVKKILGDDPLAALRKRAEARPKGRIVDRESLLRAMAERKACKDRDKRRPERES